MKGAFGRRTFAEIAGGHPWLAQLLVGQRESHRQRQAAAHDRVAAVEAGARVEQVHRAAAPAGATLLLTEHLGHDLGHRDTPKQGVRVISVGGHHRILGFQHPQRPGGHRLFTDV